MTGALAGVSTCTGAAASGSSIVQKVDQAQPGIRRKPTVKSDPFATVLDRQGGMISIRNPITRQPEGGGHAAEYAPMTATRTQRHASGLRKQRVGEGGRGLAGSRGVEDPRVGQYAQHAAEHELRQTNLFPSAVATQCGA